LEETDCKKELKSLRKSLDETGWISEPHLGKKTGKLEEDVWKLNLSGQLIKEHRTLENHLFDVRPAGSLKIDPVSEWKHAGDPFRIENILNSNLSPMTKTRMLQKLQEQL